MAEKYTVNGTDATTVIQHLQTIDGNVGVPTPMQEDYLVPGRVGAIAAKPWVGPRTLTLAGLVVGTASGTRSARDDCLNKLRTLGKTFFANGTAFTLRRETVNTNGLALVVESAARYLGGLESAQFDAPNVARVAADFVLLDGYFHGTATTTGTVTATSSVVVDGDVPTSRVTVTFTGGTAAQRLINTSTGSWVQYGTAAGGTAVALDVQAFTATSGSASVVGNVTFNAADGSRPWLTLLAGTNNLQLTGGGTAVITWIGEYL